MRAAPGGHGAECPISPCPGMPGWEQTMLAPGFAAAKEQCVLLVCLGKDMVSRIQPTT